MRIKEKTYNFLCMMHDEEKDFVKDAKAHPRIQQWHATIMWPRQYFLERRSSEKRRDCGDLARRFCDATLEC